MSYPYESTEYCNLQVLLSHKKITLARLACLCFILYLNVNIYTPNGKFAEKSSVLKESDTLIQEVVKPEQFWFHSLHSTSSLLARTLERDKFNFRWPIMSGLPPSDQTCA